MNLLSEAHIFRIYAQGAEAIVRLVHRLTDRIEALEAQPIRAPQPGIASLSKELARAKRTLARQSQELTEQRQINHQLLWRIRELERAGEIFLAPPAIGKSSSSEPQSPPVYLVFPDGLHSLFFVH